MTIEQEYEIQYAEPAYMEMMADTESAARQREFYRVRRHLRALRHANPNDIQRAEDCTPARVDPLIRARADRLRAFRQRHWPQTIMPPLGGCPVPEWAW